jgi:hypothetical protein
MSVGDFTTGTRIGHVLLVDHEKVAAAGAADVPDGHSSSDIQGRHAVGERHSQPTIVASKPNGGTSAGSDFPGGQSSRDGHSASAAGEPSPPASAKEGANPTAVSPTLAIGAWVDSNAPLLALLADVLDDLERTRIANENRLRQLTRDEADSDGEERGFGLTLDQPQVAALADVVTALGKLEHQSTLNLQRAVRKHPLGPWVKATVGVGEKQGARLLAAIGDPYWNTLHDRPRLVSELWAYCGLHVLPAAQSARETHTGSGGGGKQGDPGHSPAVTHSGPAGVAPTRARGQRANWSTVAKTRAYLIAESCIKQARSPYRAVYDDGRTKYADAIHAAPCRRCGPSGKPADTGTPLSAGHQHARAMRLVMKELLRDLWSESKRLHADET